MENWKLILITFMTTISFVLCIVSYKDKEYKAILIWVASLSSLITSLI